MKHILFLLALLAPSSAYAGPNSPCYYFDSTVRCVPSEGVDMLSGQTYMMDGVVFLDNKGTQNTWVGDTGNTTHTTGQRNTLVGTNAGFAISDGSNNTFVGYQSGVDAASTIGTSCFGYQSCRGVTANGVVGMGLESLFTGAGLESTGIGRSTLYNADNTAIRNSGFGFQSLVNVTTGDSNVCGGHTCLLGLETGSGNSGLGAETTLGAAVSASIVLGRGSSATASNEMVVGSETYPVLTYVLGEGETTTTPGAITIKPSAASGTDVAGADLSLGAGQGTGSGAGGTIHMQTSAAGASAATLRSLTDVAFFDINGMTLPNQLATRFREASGGGTNYVAIVAPAALSGDFTMTLPAATDTFVGKATTDTFTNKTFNADGTGNSITNIENADIKASANIAYSKLADGDALSVLGVTGNVSGANASIVAGTDGFVLRRNGVGLDFGTIGSGSITNDSIVNADVNSAAAIERSKLANGTASHVLINDGSGVMSSEATLALTRGGCAKALTAAAGGLLWTDADSCEVGSAGTASQWALSGGTGAPTFSNTSTTGKFVDGSADEIQMRVKGHSTQSASIVLTERDDGTNLMSVENSGLVISSRSDTTIASDAITKTTSFVRLDTEGGAASDDLATINGGTTEGEIVVLVTTSDARDVVVKNGGPGNIRLAGSADFTLVNNESTLTLILNGSNWLEIARSAF